MAQTHVTRDINAPASVVFQTVADIRQFSKALPHVVKYEFLTELPIGIGTRFRESRLMNGKEATTELKVTEYVDNERVRMVADSHGTVWDTVFNVAASGELTHLSLTMDARAKTLLPKIMNFLIKGMIKKAVERDMDLVKAFCEERVEG